MEFWNRQALLIAVTCSFAAGCGAGADVATTTQEVRRGAAFTTFDRDIGGCGPGSSNGVNCNHYACEDDVYLNGGPDRAHGGNVLADGDYYFAVLTPGSQNGGAAQGASGNLSDDVAHGGLDTGSGDGIDNRRFQMVHGALVYGGTHPLGTSPNGQPIVRVAPFDITSNPGGVYILAVCAWGSSDPADCKFDAFKTSRCAPPPPECQSSCPEWDATCVLCPPTCDPNCSSSTLTDWDASTCTPCPPSNCDPSCDPTSCSACTPCL